MASLGPVEIGQYVWPDGLEAWLNQTTRPYPTVQVQLPDGTFVPIAETWKTDIERLGNPDQFLINGELIEKPPITEAEKMEILQKLQKGNRDLVRQWTEIWSYRVKASLINEVMHQFHEEYGLYPVIGRGGYKSVQIFLDTQSGVLIVHVEGNIEHATDENSDLHKVHAKFNADLIYKPQEEVMKFLVEISAGE